MGNILGGSKRRTTTKIMNIKGETTKHKTPIQAMEITKHHPGHVLIDSGAVNRVGPRAKPVDPTGFLEARKVYLLVERPEFPNKEPRRVRSSGGIHVSAKDRLESLMLSRRTVSDLSSAMKSAAAEGGAGTVRIRLPKAEVERLVKESKDKADAAEKIVGLCIGKTGAGLDTGTKTGSGKDVGFGLLGQCRVQMPQIREQPRRGVSPLGRVPDGCKKRVGFMPVNEVDIGRLIVA